MGNPRFVKGETSTHFIESETYLLEGMKKIIEREKLLAESLSQILDERKKAAAIAAVIALTRLPHSEARKLQKLCSAQTKCSENKGTDPRQATRD